MSLPGDIAQRPLPSLELVGPPLGYIFECEGRDIASAELIHPGAVRIADTTGTERDAIATAAAALLLQPQRQ